MATAMKERASEQIFLNVPTADIGLFKGLMSKLGWEYETRKDALKRFIMSRPKDVDLSDEEIMEEVRAVRYK